MSETYTTGCTKWVNLSYHCRAAQTFTPVQDHIIQWIDLRLSQFWLPVTLEVYITPHAELFDDPPSIISHSTEQFPIKWTGGLPRVYRFRMTPFLLLAGIKYAIVVYEHIPAIFGAIAWYYDEGDATYPRGNRYYKAGEFLPWEAYGSDDHWFAEWGAPPAPETPQMPPIDKWASLGIAFNYWDIGLTICLSTNVPCHLTCYWTDKEPRKHHTERTIRGITVPWGTYFCFVAWQSVEQNEPGDTLYHSFDIPTWETCQTRYFTFRGTEDEVLSPSVGPIFQHHNPGGLPRTFTLRPNAPGDLCTIQQQIGWLCPNHWRNIDDIIPDEDASCIFAFSAATSGWKKDLYNLPDLDPSVRKIDSVSITARRRRKDGMAYAARYKIILKTHGIIYTVGSYSGFSETYQNQTVTLPNNPNTGLPWTPAEINDLQIGVDLYWYWGVGWQTKVRVTQLYIDIAQGIICP